MRMTTSCPDSTTSMTRTTVESLSCPNLWGWQLFWKESCISYLMADLMIQSHLHGVKYLRAADQGTALTVSPRVLVFEFGVFSVQLQYCF